jgi:predicted DsbA family dithiol-disulfide isomerase
MSETYSSIVRLDSRLAPAVALHVEVVADVICPFCYLGKRRLDQALQAVQGPSDVAWYPYQLNPDMPAGGVSTTEYLSARFGSPANVQPALSHLVTEGRKEGIEFRFDRIGNMPNTLRAHQILYLAEAEGADQGALAEELMCAFFERGADIGDTETLLDLASRHGLAAPDVLKVIDDEAAKQVVLSREAQVRSSGIAGVPGYLLNRRLLVIGAQETDVLVSAFDQAMFGEGTDGIGSPALH